MHASGGLAGVAITVRSRPGDKLMLHKAIDLAGPGDVIVVDAGGDLTNSLMGELMLAHAVRRGVAGFVLNGAIRDAMDFLKRSEEHTSELQSLMRISYAVFCLKKKK